MSRRLYSSADTGSHRISEFLINPNYGDSDPLQKKFVSNLQDLVSVDGLPLSFVSGLGFRNLIYDINLQQSITKTASKKCHKVYILNIESLNNMFFVKRLFLA